MDKKNSEIMRDYYIDRLLLAKGDMSINQFARHAGISPGNFCRMLKGQPAKPDTLKRIALARPEIDHLYEELMYAAGYTSVTPGKNRVETRPEDDISGEIVALPVISELKGSKSKILYSNRSGSYYCSKSMASGDKCFIFQANDEGMSPLIHNGDMVIFDSRKEPADGDIVLFRIRKKEGLIRYYRKANSKIIAYSSDPDILPEFFNKSDVDIIGVAVKLIISL